MRKVEMSHLLAQDTEFTATLFGFERVLAEGKGAPGMPRRCRRLLRDRLRPRAHRLKQHYLLEDQAIYYAPSLSVLREMSKKERVGRNANSLIAFGNPVIGKR